MTDETSKYYYCAICDIELKDVELEGCNCLYCGTEIPDAREEIIGGIT